MAVNSFPFPGRATTELQYSLLFSQFTKDGVDRRGRWGEDSLRVLADSTGMKVKVSPGFGVVRGFGLHVDAVETLNIGAASSSRRVDMVVMEMSMANDSVTLKVVPGYAGSSSPRTPIRSDSTYQVPLANVNVSGGATTITPGDVTDRRDFLGDDIGFWHNSSRREANAYLGSLGYNKGSDQLELYGKNGWRSLSTSWSDIDGKPTTFKPESHSHSWGQITGKPSTFKPESHTHPWGHITSKPSSFPPSSHKHSGSDINGSVDNARDAYGTTNAHRYAASGSGPWYAVWVNAAGRFMRNTSSIRYKENVRPADIHANKVLAIIPRIYDRKPIQMEDGSWEEGCKDEFGLIAEEVAEHLPEIVVRNEDGEIDTVRYDLLAVAQQAVIQQHEWRIGRLTDLAGSLLEEIESLRADVESLRDEINR